MEAENLLEAFDLLVRLADVLAQALADIRIILDALHLALHDPECFLLDRMRIAQADYVDRVHLVGRLSGDLRCKAAMAADQAAAG
jgi:hypothetical protein